MSRILLSALVVGGVFLAGLGSTFAQEKKPAITGQSDPDLAALDEMMTKFLADHDVPGASLAVTKDGRLVYARGFGFADQDAGAAVQPTTRFRIASISKPITAAMILRLIELGLVKMDDNPFAFLGLALPDDADPRLEKITIRHLLQHTAGWDRSKSFDPMVRSLKVSDELKTPPPATPQGIIAYMLRQKLDFDPGARYAYSNFGYCVLGRVIEKAAGMPYDKAVQKHLFDLLGIRSTELGRTRTPAKNEAKYYDTRVGKSIFPPDVGQEVPAAYGMWSLEAMDAHGGWISTASDLVRFASAFDRPKKSPLLSEKSIETMFARPDGRAGLDKEGNPRDVFYGCGWSVRRVDDDKINAWHNGALDGSASLLVRRADGFNWAVLMNARVSGDGVYLGSLIDPLVHQAVNAVKRWPK